MSAVQIQGNASGTGTLTVAAPNTNTNQTLTLPDQTGTLLTGAGAIGVNASAPTSSLNLDASGNVGIGTSSPVTKFEVRSGYITAGTASSTAGAKVLGAYYGASGHLATFGTEYSNGSPILGYAVWPSTSAAGSFVSSTTGALTRGAYTILGNNHIWYGGGSQTVAIDSAVTTAEFMRVDGNGNLLVGSSTGSSRLGVYGNGTTNPVGIFVGTTAGDVAISSATFYKYDNNSTTSQVFQRFVMANGSNASGQINANGASAAAFGAYSDHRLKENIVDLPSQLANIMALRPVEFDYIESEGGGHQIGFIAQEVQDIYPDLVGERADGMLTLSDMNKNDARLIKAIQEQQALIIQLQADVAALKAGA
jgi:hypothetical protein